MVSPPWPRRLLRNLAIQDVCVLVYFLYQLVILLSLRDSEHARAARPPLVSLTVLALVTITLVRGDLLPDGRLRALGYRLSLVGAVVGCYLAMRDYLLARQAVLLDAPLLQLDRALFGETPALAWQHLATPAVVEWFAFFYFSYYALHVLNVLGSALFDDGPRMAELLFSAMFVACAGYVGYTLIPGVGPHATLEFEQPLRGYTFFGLVQGTVAAAGAQLDIFPSLHTAFPTLFALHAFRHRGRAPFRYLWPLSALFAFNIVIATMFLRWHYAVDVVAGLGLALGAHRLGIRVVQREARRPSQGRQPAFDALWAAARAAKP